MKPTISTSKKGSITIENTSIDYDFYINTSGRIIKRNRKFISMEDSSIQFISLLEAGELFDPNVNEMIIGCDDSYKLTLSNEAYDFFEEKRCKIKLLPLDEAILYWNRYEGRAIALFHLPKRLN